jgi:O-antigen ligase/tetratricopeptide (TPR) repeat protein
MKKNRIKLRQKKHIETENKVNLRFILILLSMVPVFFSAIFQGGYFPWETYLTFILALPAIFLFVFLKIKPEEGLRKSGADLSLFIFLLVTFISLFFTVYFHATLAEFFKVIIYLALFYIVLNCVENQKDIDLILNSVLGLSLILSILGIIANFAYRFNLSGAFYNFLSVNGFTQAGRVASTLQYSNTFAAFIIVPFFISFSYFIIRKKWFEKAIYLALSVVFLITFALTESRGALIALFIALIIYIILLRGKDRKFSLISLVVLVVILVIAIFVKKDIFFPIFRSFAERLKQLVLFFQGQWQESLGDRVTMAKDSINFLKNRPILGTGNGTYQYVYAKYRTIYFFSKYPHSIFFQILDELGIAGGAAYLFMIFSLFKKGFRVIRTNYSPILVALYAGLAALFLHSLVDFDWSLMFMPMFFLYLFGIVFSSGNKEYFAFKCPMMERMKARSKLVKDLKPVDTGKIMIGRMKKAGVVFASILLVVFLFQFIAAFIDFRTVAEIGKVQPSQTISDYKTAIAFDPLSAEYHYGLANFEFMNVIPYASDPTSFVNDAISQYQAAIKRCPEFFMYHFELGKLYLQTSNSSAIDELAKAVQLNPIDAGAHATLAFAYLQLKKNTSMAKIQLDEALKLDSKNSDVYLGYGSLYEELGENDKALENYLLAIKYNAKSAYAYYRAGVIYEGEGMIPEAINNLFYATFYNPSLSEAVTELQKYAPIITISQPQSGITLSIGTQYIINWSPSNTKNVAYYSIWLVPENGDKILLKDKIPVNSNSYEWTPEDILPGSYKIRIYAMSPDFMQGKFDNWLTYGEAQINIAK